MESSSKCRDFSPTCGKQQQQQSVNDYKIEMLNPFVKEEVKRFVFISIVAVEMLTAETKLYSGYISDLYSITCECFSQKGDLELLTGVKYEDYEPLLDDVWEHFLVANLRYFADNVNYLIIHKILLFRVFCMENSFILKNLQGRTVACGMNCDAYDVPKLNPRAKALDYVFEVLEHAKGPAR